MSEEIVVQAYTPSRAQIVSEAPASPSPQNVESEQSDLIQRLHSLQQIEEAPREATQAQIVRDDVEVPQQQIETKQVEEVPDLDEGFDAAEIAKFSKIFEKMFGVKVEEFKQTQQQVISQQKEVALRNDLNTLQNEWGVDEAEVAHRIELVSQKLQTLPEKQREALDNLEGIRLLWSAIGTTNAPRFEKTNKKGNPSGNKPMFTQREIDAMSQRDYAANAAAILYAYKNGLVQK